MRLQIKKSSIPFCPKLHQNKLLSSLSHDECGRVCPHLERVRVESGEVLCSPGEKSGFVYFPLDCFASLSHIMEDDSSYAAALVGHEGALCHSMLEDMAMPYTVVCQSAGHVVRIRKDILQREFGCNHWFNRRLLRYSQALMAHMGLNAACTRHHALIEQLSHLLLQIGDRLSSDEIALTQECISSLLGVRRERVNKAALELQDEGILRYSRGRIHILDRPRLLEQSCGCYATIRSEFNRLHEQDEVPSPCLASAVE